MQLISLLLKVCPTTFRLGLSVQEKPKLGKKPLAHCGCSKAQILSTSKQLVPSASGPAWLYCHEFVAILHFSSLTHNLKSKWPNDFLFYDYAMRGYDSGSLNHRWTSELSRLVSVYTFLMRSMIFIIYSFTQKIVIKWPRAILGTRSTTVKKKKGKPKKKSTFIKLTLY